MQSEITVLERQGFLYVIDVDGREFPVPAGGSGNEPPPSTEGGEGGGTAPTGTEGDGVQPGEGGQPAEPSGGQGFIQPYLEDVPEEIRPTVEQKLEQFRKDQDAQVTRRFDQLQEETQIPVTVYNALMNDPVGTLQWITERFQEDRGIDLRSQLLEQWDVQPNEPAGGEKPDPDKPLTQAELNQILEEREQQRQQEIQQQESEAQRIQQQTQTVHGWMDEAAGKYGLEFEDKDGTPDPLRTAIALQANELHNSGQARGKAAVEMVVEAFSKRLGSTGGSNGGQSTNEPRVAKGGSTPPAKDIDVSDPKQRRDRMYELFGSGQ